VAVYTKRRVGHLIINFGATKPPAHPEDGDAVSARNAVKPSQPDAAVCPKIISSNSVAAKA